MNKQTFYIAGPMRGHQFFNFPAFDRARDILLALGHGVVSPADLDRARGFDGMNCAPDDPCLGGTDPNFDMRACIIADMNAVMDSDGVCFIDPEWRKSMGSKAEYWVARWAYKPVYLLDLETGVLTELGNDAL